MATNKNNKNNAQTAIDLALAKMEEFGRTFATAEYARYDAAVYYGAQVKEGLATAADADKFVAAYVKGTGNPLSDGSLKTVVANFRAFASKETIERRDEIEKAVKAALAGKNNKERGGKDLFAAAYGVNSKINAAVKAGKPVPPLAAIVADVVKEKAKTVPTPAKVEPAIDPIVEAKALIVDMAKRLETVKAKDLPRGAKAAIAALLALKW